MVKFMRFLCNEFMIVLMVLWKFFVFFMIKFVYVRLLVGKDLLSFFFYCASSLVNVFFKNVVNLILFLFCFFFGMYVVVVLLSVVFILCMSDLIIF